MKEFKFTIDGKQHTAAVNELEDNFAEVTIDGKSYKVQIEKEEAPAAAAAVRRPAAAAAPAAAQPAGLMTVKSPLPGSIMKVLVAAGKAVKKGDVLLTMESMKMENNVCAEADGTVKAVFVEPGKNVMQDDKLLEIETVAVAAAPAAAPAPKAAPAPAAAPAPKAAPKAEVPAGGIKVVSPLPGSVIKVLVSEGQDVKKGDTLLTLESMKMENAIKAEQDGKVTKIVVTAGQSVMQEDVLMVLG